jgi:ABC-type lipoprotein export system ATPase subunit
LQTILPPVTLFSESKNKGDFGMLIVQNLRKTYRVGQLSYEVLKGVSFRVERGEFVAVMGPSGSGKTTMLNCISCYIPFDEGEITLGDTNLAKLDEDALAEVRNQRLGFVFQDFMLLDGLTVKENIILPRIIGGKTDGAMEESAGRLCQIFGISHIREKYPAEISGGERQRTAVARALINDPLVILADEPTGNLDSKSSRAVIDTFRSAKEKLNATIFMVTHDSFAASFCDRVIIMKDGVVHSSLANPGDTGAFQNNLLAAIKEISGGDAA